jgi:uncharacterized protein
MKILCDHMLGSLATWLRIVGFDTLYPDSTTTDEQLLIIAAQEHRLLITRDKELIRRGKKLNIDVLELTTTNLDEQLQLVFSHVPFDPSKVLSRCTLCNTLLTPIHKNKVKDAVPPKVFETRNEFWHCLHCNKYYWMGTQYENMIQKINELQQKKQ